MLSRSWLPRLLCVGRDHRDDRRWLGWRQCKMTFTPMGCHGPKQLTWPRTDHSGDCWRPVALRTRSGASQRWWDPIWLVDGVKKGYFQFLFLYNQPIFTDGWGLPSGTFSLASCGSCRLTNSVIAIKRKESKRVFLQNCSTAREISLSTGGYVLSIDRVRAVLKGIFLILWWLSVWTRLRRWRRLDMRTLYCSWEPAWLHPN